MLDLQDPNIDPNADPNAGVPVGADPNAVGVPLGLENSDQLSTGDLSSLAGAGTDAISGDQAQEDQMLQQLQDPNTDPALKIQLQQQLAIAARRRLAGMGDTTTPIQ